MTNELPTMTVKAIGIVRNDVKEEHPAGYQWGDVVSEIVIHPSLTEALDGLEEFSHIIVLYWMHRVTEDVVTHEVHPMRNPELPLTGLFATRTPNRPNRIGKTTVRLLQLQGNVLTVKGLDALDGTPVIDIKPYIPGYDSAADSKMPRWVTSR